MRLLALGMLWIQRVIFPFLAIIFNVAKSGEGDGVATVRASASAAAKPDLLRGSQRCWRICMYVVLEMRVTPSGE